MPAKRRLRVGDVVDLKHPRGFAYVQYLGRHEFFGDAVAVSPQLHDRAQEVAEALFNDAYVAFYPVGKAVRDDIAVVVGSLDPITEIPQAYRRDTTPLDPLRSNWIVEGIHPSIELRLIPYGEIWNHPMLLHQIESGWTPEIGFAPVQRPNSARRR